MALDQELDAQRKVAIDLFIKERKEEGDAAYKKEFFQNRKIVQRLFKATDFLRNLDGSVLSADPGLLDAARFLAAPPVSEDDLDTLVGRNVVNRRTLPVDLAQQTLDVLNAMIDTIRCPWLDKDRKPTRAEVEKAIDWTTGILTIEQLRTDRRIESAKRQQDAVVNLLLAKGWVEEPRKPIHVLDDLPRGHFCRETEVSGSKCDVPIRLHDGRLLALECKVSNSSTNSVKRLIRETCGKADLWRRAYGQQLVTGAVLAGVYKLKNLIDAQNNYGVSIFWEHDLTPLLDFITP